MNAISVLLINGMPQTNITITPSMGLFKLKHYLEQRGITCDVLAPDLGEEATYLSRTAEGRYDVIGISGSHWNMVDDLDRLWRFRQAAEASGKAVIYIAGGQEASLNPDVWLRNGIQVIFLGFAEKSLYHFCSQLQATPEPFQLDNILRPISGVLYLDRKGRKVMQHAEPLTRSYFHEITYLQAMTMEIPYRKYWDALRARSADTGIGSEFVFEYVRLYTTSHCPRRCGFCNSQNFLPAVQQEKLNIQFLSAGQIVDLVLENVKKYNARGFAFSDDDFPIGNKSGIDRVMDFSRTIIDLKQKGRLDPNIHFAIQARIADFLVSNAHDKRTANIPLMERMVQAGFRSIALGVETFSDRLLRVPSINKIGVTADDCHAVLQGMMKTGLIPLMNIILGIPEATPDELAETLAISMDYIVKGCEINVTGPLYALPGAPLYTDPRYQIRSSRWENPHTGKVEDITNYYIPHHGLIHKISANYEKHLEAELDAFRKANGLEGKILHKRIKNVIAIIVAAKLLNRSDQVTSFGTTLTDLAEGKLRINA